MRKFNKVAIIGVGLIGGSIGLGIKRKKAAREVIGIFRRQSTLKKALRYKAVDKGTLDIREGVSDADLVVLATPVLLIPSLALKVLKYAKSGAVITDAGSTKAWIVKTIERMAAQYPSVSFVGSHPMAGSDRTGAEFARRDLIEGAPCIVTKTKKTDRAALDKVVAFWRALGAKVEVMSPAAHDRNVSMISHLPHIVAFSLAEAVSGRQMRYAAEGFRDTTRVASSDPALWAGIFLTNKSQILRACGIFERRCRELLKAIEKLDRRKVCAILRKAKSKRDSFTYGK